jgi:hypothetical protein
VTGSDQQWFHHRGRNISLSCSVEAVIIWLCNSRTRAEESKISFTAAPVANVQDNQVKHFSVKYKVVPFPSSINCRFDESQTKSTSAPGAWSANVHTCTLLHLDIIDDLDATLSFV